MKKVKNKGITLVALVITVIILLILAGISISALTGSGLFEKAKLAKERTKEKEEEERIKIEEYGNEVGKYIDGDRNTTVSNVLWRRTSVSTENKISWTESIENYKYLFIQIGACEYGTDVYLRGLRGHLVDVDEIKRRGYVTENFSGPNSHVFFPDHYSAYLYLAFTSDKSLCVTECSGIDVNAIVKITGIK